MSFSTDVYYSRKIHPKEARRKEIMRCLRKDQVEDYQPGGISSKEKDAIPRSLREPISVQKKLYKYPNVCNCCWSKSQWYTRHHRDRKQKGINKDKMGGKKASHIRAPSFKSKQFIRQEIEEGFYLI